MGFVENMIPKGEKNLESVPGTTKVVMKLHTLVSLSPRQRSQTAMKTQVVDQNYYSCREIERETLRFSQDAWLSSYC